ncbi:hypothetical protein N9053_01470 [bacterium]|nr:hypothetical protein [bacterium]
MIRYFHARLALIRYPLKRVEVLYNSIFLAIFGLAVRRLPTSLLILVLFPPALIKTAIEIFLPKNTAAGYWKLIAGLTSTIPPVPIFKISWVRLRLNINRLMTYSGGQIRDPKWQARIEYSGFKDLLDQVTSGRSVLLASVHYGSPREASTIIRSQGLRLSALAYSRLTPLEEKSVKNRDQLWGLEHVPVILNPDEMWAARDFLREPGNMLLLLIDRQHNPRDMTGTFLGGQIRVAKGVVKFAEMTNAVVVPVACTSTGFLRWRLWFGEGMDCDGDANILDSQEFLQRILRQLESEIENNPEQMQPELIGSMIKTKNKVTKADKTPKRSLKREQ